MTVISEQTHDTQNGRTPDGPCIPEAVACIVTGCPEKENENLG